MTQEIYICVHHSDRNDEDRLRNGLKPILGRYDLALWGTRDIDAGYNRTDKIKEHLEKTTCFVALATPALLASDGCFKEIQAAHYRAQYEGIKIVSILLRRMAFFNDTELALYDYLPTSGVPIAEDSKPDKVWAEILRDLVEMISASHRYIRGTS